MKIIHFSDTHLGISMENNLRSEDFYKNFLKVIDDILEQKPDFVIFSGDLFNSSKPSNKAISIAIQGFLKLEKANIKTIIIAGNHDTPRLSTTTHVFSIFEKFENFRVAYKEQLHIFEEKEINFVCLPHIYDEIKFKQEFNKGLDKINKNKLNIFVSHFGLQAKEYEEYTDEISGVNILIEELEKLKNFDYVALGHYHKNFCISKKICYSGSLEHTSFNAKDHKIGYNILEISKSNFSKKTIALPSRKMIDLGNFNCENINTTQELIEKLEEKIKKDNIILKDSIVKIFFENINNNLLLEFQDKKLIEFFSETFYFEYKKSKAQEKNITFNGKIDISKKNFIEEVFKDFLKKVEIPENIDKKSLEKELLEKIK